MKKFLLVVIMLVIAAFIAIAVFGYYNSGNILSNQAAFEIYFNVPDDEVDDFFDLTTPTFDSKLHKIICELPVDVNGFKAKSRVVSFDSGNIDCDQGYNPEKHIKYDNAELNDQPFKLFIVKSNVNPMTFDSSLPLTQMNIIAEKSISVDYTKGKLNYIIFSKNKAYEYCTHD